MHRGSKPRGRRRHPRAMATKPARNEGYAVRCRTKRAARPGYHALANWRDACRGFIERRAASPNLLNDRLVFPLPVTFGGASRLGVIGLGGSKECFIWAQTAHCASRPTAPYHCRFLRTFERSALWCVHVEWYLEGATGLQPQQLARPRRATRTGWLRVLPGAQLHFRQLSGLYSPA